MNESEMTHVEKANTYEQVEEIFQALTDGSMPVLVIGIKNKELPFCVSNISDGQARRELLEHFVKKENEMLTRNAN